MGCQYLVAKQEEGAPPTDWTRPNLLKNLIFGSSTLPERNAIHQKGIAKMHEHSATNINIIDGDDKSCNDTPTLQFGVEQANQMLETIRPRFGPNISPTLPEPPQSPPPIPDNIQWNQYQLPFRHFRATDVFDEHTYQALSHQFNLILETTAGKRDGRYKMRPAPGNNDGLILGLTNKLAAAFPPLFTEAWLRSLAALFDLPFLPRVEGALHSNPQGSRTGWIHTDCCSAWFDESLCTPGVLTLPPRGRCNYFTGQAKVAGTSPAEYIRAATMIFYLCNDGWQNGDGGETGIYNAAHETPDTSVTLIPPINNSLFFFECSPHSFHRFIGNPGRTRNSIILWLHSPIEAAEARWGDGINRRGAR